MKKLKLKFVKWLLREQSIGFVIANNHISENAVLSYCTFSVNTSANIVLNDVELPKGTQILITNPK